jgi:hypothetical protein
MAIRATYQTNAIIPMRFLVDLGKYLKEGLI